MSDPATPPDCSGESEPASPGSLVSPEPDQPRLRILHLMAWTASVAVFFSASRPFYTLLHMESEANVELLWLLHGVGSGTALGGLFLCISRRHRGLPFPSQPGEWILVSYGAAAAAQVPGMLLIAVVGWGKNPLIAHILSPSLLVTLFLAYTIPAVLCLIAVDHVKTYRWRAYLVILASSNLLACSSPHMRLLSSPILAVIVLQDVRRGIRRRWTHWLGIAIEFWNTAIAVVYFATLGYLGGR